MLERRSRDVERLTADARERLIFFIHVQVVSGRTRYIYLEQRYGIGARKWKNVCNRLQMPGISMFTAIANDYPEVAEWLLTGKVTTQGQVDLTTTHDLDKTQYGRIDPTEPGWEEKLEKIWKAQYDAINERYSPK